MGILDADVEMDGSSVFKKQNKKDVKAISKNAGATLSEKKEKMKKKGEKAAVLKGKQSNMNEMKVLKNQIWMKVIKDMADRKNLIPIHEELLKKLTGRTVVPQHKDRFSTFVVHSLKINKEKFGKSIEELFGMLKKNFRRSVQGAGLQKAAVAAAKNKKEAAAAVKPGKKVVDKSSLTKSQRQRLRKKERVQLARARDGVLQPPKKKNTKGGLSKSKKPQSPKAISKKINVNKVKKPQKKVMKKDVKKGPKKGAKKEAKMEVDS